MGRGRRGEGGPGLEQGLPGGEGPGAWAACGTGRQALSPGRVRKQPRDLLGSPETVYRAGIPAGWYDVATNRRAQRTGVFVQLPFLR